MLLRPGTSVTNRPTTVLKSTFPMVDSRDLENRPSRPSRSIYLYIKVLLLFFYISIYGHIRTDLGFSILAQSLLSLQLQVL